MYLTRVENSDTKKVSLFWHTRYVVYCVCGWARAIPFVPVEPAATRPVGVLLASQQTQYY